MSSETERTCLDYKNCSQRFTEKFSAYDKQYCSIYLSRLRDMETLLVQRVQQKWGDRYPICKLHKLTEEQYDKCVVIGTLFKDQKLKPSVLKHIAESNQLMPQPIVTHFTDESDVLLMEDEVQRYQLIGKGNIDPTRLVTGITCALLGSDMGKGKFQVDEFIFAGYRDQIERPIFDSSVFILFLSGLNFVEHEKFLPNLKLLTYWISGFLDDTASKVCRVIIAGNSIRNEAQKTKETISMISRVPESQESIDAVKAFDKFLLKLCQVIEVDVMPGEHDPSNHIFPQKPMHFCMFPESSIYKSFNQVSNPYQCELGGGFKLMGTSGQSIRDIKRYCDITDSLEGLENCLIWNHLAPTAPDTLGCFPYYSEDPFIIQECPHAFFAGNQEEFGSKIVTGEDGQKVRIISIPDFSKSYQGVLLNLQNLDCHPIAFETK